MYITEIEWNKKLFHSILFIFRLYGHTNRLEVQ